MYDINEDYLLLIHKILKYGQEGPSRAGNTVSLFGEQIVIKDVDKLAPLITVRKMHTAGILGEWAALIRGPKHVSDFEKWGCNYWKKWAKPDGSINLDYGNAWHRNNQIEKLKYNLLHDKSNRRMIISGWDPSTLSELDLPCCHCFYQFKVNPDNTLDLLWYQRSVDVLVGLPSDFILAFLFLISVANFATLKPGKIIMSMGDVHIYDNQFDKMSSLYTNSRHPISYSYTPMSNDFVDFIPSDVKFNMPTNIILPNVKFTVNG